MDVSVILCTYNRGERLKKTLDSLAAQEALSGIDFEIIIVDNNSKDATKDVVSSYQPRFNGRLRYVFEPQQGISKARNRGIKESYGEITVFTDDDVLLSPKWIREVYDFFRRHNDADAMGGQILPGYPPETPQWIKDNRELLSGPIVSHDYGPDDLIYNAQMCPLVGANMAFRKAVFSRYGNFKTDLGAGAGTVGEDSELYKRICAGGAVVYYCGQASICHPVEADRMTLKYIAKWKISAARGYVVLYGDEFDRKKFVYIFGVPRYLLRELLGRGISLIKNFTDRQKFLVAWINFFYTIGVICEFRRRNQNAKS